MTNWIASEGAPSPLGVSWVENDKAYNFALYSKHAWEVTLLAYQANDFVQPVFEYVFDPLINKTNRIWHCRIPEQQLNNAKYYAYRINGPAPQGRFEWHNFDADKIVLDPYAKTVFFPPDHSRLAAINPGSNAGRAPLGLLSAATESFDWEGDQPLRHESDLVIYELHVRQFTRNPNSGVTDSKRGTFTGLIEKIPYLQELGVSAVELMPVHQCDPQEGSAWGYMTLNFFAPHSEYASTKNQCGQINEFKTMVKALHKAGIEVILDVVYNHSAEGNHQGPLYSFKGIDNSTYYLLTGNSLDPYANYTGTGNTINSQNRYVRRFIMDSLRYWVTEMHVDGFRFDLASTFSRNTDGSVNLDDPAIFGEIASDPALRHIRLIAEPWDASDVYQLGRNFPGLHWMQWNGQYRDDLRRFVKSDPGLVNNMISRLYGSDDLFPGDLMNAYHPYQSINYIASHDGFTLYDQVAYNDKHNWANGHNNTDGHSDNNSWNCGWEGDANVPQEILQLRQQQVKNFCTLLFLSNGVPMFRAGDEFLQTQGGNNNPYNQDNENIWLDWSRRQTFSDIFIFFKKMIAFRKRHPSLSRSRFWRDDVRWYGMGSQPDRSTDSRSLAFYLRGDSEGDKDIYVMINAYWESLNFSFQEPGNWFRVIDTNIMSPNDFVEETDEPINSTAYIVGPRSIAVFTR